MGDTMHSIGLKVDAHALASGMLDLMRKQSPDNEVLISFGLLPAKWMEMVKQSVESRVRECYHVPKGHDEHTVLINPGDLDTCRQVTFKVSHVVSEAMHEVSLELYGLVDMVV